jgi:hypothetical protein
MRDYISIYLLDIRRLDHNDSLPIFLKDIFRFLVIGNSSRTLKIGFGGMGDRFDPIIPPELRFFYLVPYVAL